MSNIGYYSDKIFNNGSDIGFISPRFQTVNDPSLKQSIQIITKQLIDDYAISNRLIIPGFVYNIIDIYQDNVNTDDTIESRGIIQLYTIYFILQLISAYWTGVQHIRYDLINNNHNILDLIVAHHKPEISSSQNINTVNSNSIKNKINDAYNVFDILLNPQKKKDIKIPIGIKYFLFKRPVNIDWRYYDTILYYSLILIITIYNYIYFLKTLPQLDKHNEKKVKKYLYHNSSKHPKLNTKAVGQLFMLFGFIKQHSSLAPYTNDISMEKTIKTQKSKNESNQNKLDNQKEINDELINNVENTLSGLKPNNINNETFRKKHTIGSYSILTIIFKLMYYHPFPYDSKQLKQYQKHPIVTANNTREQQLKHKMGQENYNNLMTNSDKEAVEIMGEITGFFTGAATQVENLNKFARFQRKSSYTDKNGRKQTALNPMIKQMMSSSIKRSTSPNIYSHAQKIMNQQNNKLIKHHFFGNNNNRKSKKRRLNKKSIF
jgi:hypothetical protein